MAIKKVKVDNGGTFSGDFWLPHAEPDEKNKEAYAKYGNGYCRDATVIGVLKRVEVFGGEQRFSLSRRYVDYNRDEIGDPALPPLLLPDHGALVSCFEKREYNTKGEFVGVEKVYVPDGALVEISLLPEQGIVKEGKQKGKPFYRYEVFQIQVD
mgnify:CR=1 FL=1